MAIECSFGVIPLRRGEWGWEALLVQHRAGHWSFPKGRPEAGEEPLDTALRELAEETGLQEIALNLDISLSEEYLFVRDGTQVRKQVTYFALEVSGELQLQAEELVAARWLPLAHLEKLATFEEARRLCRELNQKMGGIDP